MDSTRTPGRGDPMSTVVVTGAAGGLGRRVLPLVLADPAVERRRRARPLPRADQRIRHRRPPGRPGPQRPRAAARRGRHARAPRVHPRRGPAQRAGGPHEPRGHQAAAGGRLGERRAPRRGRLERHGVRRVAEQPGAAHRGCPAAAEPGRALRRPEVLHRAPGGRLGPRRPGPHGGGAPAGDRPGGGRRDVGGLGAGRSRQHPVRRGRSRRPSSCTSTTWPPRSTSLGGPTSTALTTWHPMAGSPATPYGR